MNKRSGRKHSRRAAKKAHKRTAKKERRGTRGYRKGSKSKTMKGKMDFTTKKSSKVFNRRRHYQKHAKGSRVVRKPYHMKRGGMADLNKAYKPIVHKAVFRPHGTEVHPTNLAITPVISDPGRYILDNNSGSGPTLEGLVNAINKHGAIPGTGASPVNTANLQHITLVSPTPQNGMGKGGLYSTKLFTKSQRDWLKGGPQAVDKVATAIENYFKQYQKGGNIEGTDIPNTLKYWKKMLSPASFSPPKVTLR